MKYITPEGIEEVTIWDSLGIRSENGKSLSRSPSPSPLIPKLSLPPHLKSYQSASQFQLKNKLWVPGSPIADWWGGNLTFNMAPLLAKSLQYLPVGLSFFSRDPALPIPEPVKCQRDTPAIGFRAWQVVLDRKDNGQEFAVLQGANQMKPWPGRHTATAVCTLDPKEKHDAPSLGCACGLYAYHEPGGAPEYMHDSDDSPDTVMGAVVAWGRIIEYENGFRAQYARPIAISAPPNDDLTHQFLTAALAEKTAQLLHLPFIPYKNLTTYAREFGERLTMNQGNKGVTQ